MAEDRMPNLTRDAVAARKMGKSYGQYIAWKEEQELKDRLSEDKKYKQGPLCAICGKPISKAGRNRKYCGTGCAGKARERQNAAAKNRRKLEAAQKEVEEEYAMQTNSVQY